MSGLRVDEKACIGCGRCVRACASAGIELVGERPDRVAQVTPSCILCGMCVDACPVGALSIERDEEDTAVDLAAYHDVWVFAQTDEGTVLPVVDELLGKGRELADGRGCRLVAVLGEGEPDGAEPDTRAHLIACGADEVIVCSDPRLTTPDAEIYAAWITDLIKSYRPEIVLFGATGFGRELAPGVAARVRCGLTADCTVLQIDPETGLLQQTRPAFGGNLMAMIVCPDHRPQMATVRAGVLPAAEPDPSRTGSITEVTLDPAIASHVQVLETLASSDDDSITDADVLVVVGRGIGSEKNLPLMEHLADLLGAKLGCSRPLVEAGWCEYKHQVGQTGSSVAPKLLISIGVSGAIQHLAGIGGAETIIAINSDPDAPIFGVSQYCVVGDCLETVKELNTLLEARG